jgi:hypothetical protein
MPTEEEIAAEALNVMDDKSARAQKIFYIMLEAAGQVVDLYPDGEEFPMWDDMLTAVTQVRDITEDIVSKLED